ncbi:two-component sensor histidine kinase [Kribbella antibiotica]|uniref:histidine kinase n=1 Tax=Kribbella antibiotica TaxID=190195 RepID=A0A4R4ZGI4_9ACTN|nr:histidine kinase [Kribbella antibiotica]TDD57721.1 two-component sensor histidine kinase [Kribbella antibiotica]
MIDIRERWRQSDVMVRDLALAIVLVLISVLPALRGHGTQVGNLPSRPMDALALGVIALECLPLAVRRRWPIVTLVLTAGGFAIDQLVGFHTVAGSALPIALVSTAVHLAQYRRTTMVGASVAYVGFAFALDSRGSTEGVAGYITFYLALVVAWGIGSWVRLTRAAEVERRQHIAETTRSTERSLIARDLHDIVTHHVTAMVVQAEAARYLTAAPERLDDSLNAITDTGRRAISDLRHLLDVLNPDHGTEPRTPSVGELAALVEQTRQAGQPVEFTEEGEPMAVAGSAEVTAYRVMQEALTNALKHARGSRTTVLVRYGERELSVEIRTSAGVGSTSPGGSGRGLTGLRERVEVLGGEFTAGARDGGFVVQARIPAGGTA